jgi:hypothetical protein
MGGPRGARTHNPRIKSPLLCQLELEARKIWSSGDDNRRSGPVTAYLPLGAGPESAVKRPAAMPRAPQDRPDDRNNDVTARRMPRSCARRGSSILSVSHLTNCCSAELALHQNVSYGTVIAGIDNTELEVSGW